MCSILWNNFKGWWRNYSLDFTAGFIIICFHFSSNLPKLAETLFVWCSTRNSRVFNVWNSVSQEIVRMYPCNIRENSKGSINSTEYQWGEFRVLLTHRISRETPQDTRSPLNWTNHHLRLCGSADNNDCSLLGLHTIDWFHPWGFELSISVSESPATVIVGGWTGWQIRSSYRVTPPDDSWSDVTLSLGIMLTGTTPSMQDGRRKFLDVDEAGEVAGEIVMRSGADPLRFVEATEAEKSPLADDVFLSVFLRFRLRWRWIQLPPPPPPRDLVSPSSVVLCDDARSGSLLHLSFERRKAFLKKYFLLCMYLDMASAELWQPQKRAHCSAHRPRPLSRRFGFAPGTECKNQWRIRHHSKPSETPRWHLSLPN